MVKTFLASVVVAVSLIAAFWLGVTENQRHNELFNNVCLLDKTNVSLLEQSLADITPAVAKKFGAKEVEKSRRHTIRFIDRYRDIAPCEITVRIPKRSF